MALDQRLDLFAIKRQLERYAELISLGGIVGDAPRHILLRPVPRSQPLAAAAPGYDSATEALDPIRDRETAASPESSTR